MTNIESLIHKITEFRDERDWKQFHNPKDMAISLSLEAAEVLEHFQWKSPAEIEDHINKRRSDIGEELADVLYWVLLMSNDMQIDIAAAFEDKLIKNRQKYPIDKSIGKHNKYTEL